MKRRVLLFASTGGTHGGVEAFVAALYRHLRRDPAWEVRLLLKIRRGQPLQRSLHDLFPAEEPPPEFIRFDLDALRALASAVRWADLVHGNYPAAYLGLVCAARRTPLVLTVHNKRPPGAAADWLDRACLRGARRRWYNSQFVAGTWEGAALAPGGAVVPTVSDLPDQWVPPGERRGFVFAARWVPEKGLEELIEAYATSDLDRERHPLLLLGDGPLRATADALLRRFGGAGITAPGFVSEAVKKDRLARARWLVAPARTREDLGLTPIEARCCGVPAIVTRDGGLPEAAGAAGLVVAPGSVAELRAALQTAAAMQPGPYAERARLARASLEGYLQPLTFYGEEYRRVLAGG